MSEERFEDLFKEEKISTPKLKPGDRIDVTVAAISGESIFLDLGGKSEGIMDAAEVKNSEGEIEVQPGDTINVFFLSARGGIMRFTRRIGSGHVGLQELEDAFQAGIPVEGKVTKEIKGGFEILIAGQRGFCPYSQMDIRRIEEPEEFLDNQYQFKIIEFTSQGRNIILSARAVLEEERARQRENLIKNLEEGARVSGTVTSIRDFGAFVDIGGVDGLIPISELAWGQVDRVEDILTRDQKVEVVVRKLDWDKDRISLSLRETLENPWDNVTEKFPQGSVHRGRISRLTAFGAFITLEPGVDGLLHISKLGAGRRINHPREVLEVNQEMTVRIDAIDKDKNRISLVPDDYDQGEEQETVKASLLRQNKQPKSLGTLGDLLSAKLSEKK